MFKVVSSEIKKIVSKPGVFVLAVLLALILILGVFIYDPVEYKNINENLEGSVSELYVNFVGDGKYSGQKIKYDNLVSGTITKISNYCVNDISYKEYIGNLQNDMQQALKIYKRYDLDDPFNDKEELARKRQAVVDGLQNLKNAVINGVELAKNNTYALLISNANFAEIEQLAKDGATLIETSSDQNIADTCKQFENLYLSPINSIIDKLIFPSLPSKLIENYTVIKDGTAINKILNTLSSLDTEIKALYLTAGSKSTKAQDEQMLNLCNKYLGTANTYVNLVNYELLTNAFSFVDTDKQNNIKYLSGENEFNAKTNLIRYTYIFNHNLTENDYAHPLTIGTTSNAEKNGYDYAYFILKLFSFVIIAYAIMSACHAIAGEVKEGTMRYLAIRPVNRTKVLFGKMLAIILMSTIFAIFSTIISLIVGGVVYGLESATILTIFNGSTAITLHPLAMLMIYVFSMIVELTIYVSIALLLSCLLKSDLLAVTIMLMLYLLNILIPAFVSNPTSWLAFYPFSHISIYSLFGSSVYAPGNDFLNMVLGTKVFTNTTLWLTLTVILVIGIVVNIISSRIFKRKEL